ncbi:MAG: SPFH domain-containing protein [Planctomycetaceae bacterium]|nr:MAG: SPFH domain-containing protein [Planctomycetaceae bacterium]
MALFDKLRGEFIDIIEWTDSSNDTIVYRFPRHDNEIKMDARLTVREAQVAVFVNKGQIADVFEPGMYTLATDNLPILSTLTGWKHVFHSPFKAEVYFVNMRRFTDLKWGTQHPITLRDAEFGPVRLRAFGTYVIRVSDPRILIREIVGTDGHFTTCEISEQLRNLIVSRFADAIAESRIPVLDLAANYEKLGEFVTNKIKPDVANYGLELATLLVENISLPAAVEEALDKRTSMGAVGDLHKYTQFQAANAMEEAARNPGGMASGGMGMGMGFAIANQMGQVLAGQNPAGQHETPPLLPQAGQFYAAMDGRQAGPFDLGTLQQHISSGRLTAQTLVWRSGMTAWTPAGQIEELKNLFAGPPPLP